MRSTIILTIVLIIVQNSVAPPVTNDEEKKDDETFKDFEEHDWEADPRGPPPKFDLHYQQYLQEVVELLESDKDFKAKLRNSTEEDLQTAKVAHELKFIDYNIRTKLDELKRRELERIRHYAMKEYELTNNITITADHMDMHNQHTFEVEDLKNLILRATKDMKEQDRRRREEFKQYEMNKKLEEERKLQGLSEEERKKYAEELENMKKKHKDHKPLNHPGSKKQLEEVWEKEDHMDPNEFDPKTFFFMHDLDGNGFWDEDEVKALFLKELDKMYQQGAPEDDLIERAEEMERMREHVFSETDEDGNRLIDYQEFLKQTRRDEFENDPGWKPLDEQEIYTPDEYETYKKKHEIKNQVVEGLSPPQPDAAHNQQFPSQPVQQDPNQVPQYQQPPQQQQQYQQPPQQQQYQQPPQQQYQQPPQQQQYQPPQQQQYQQPPQQQQYQQPPQQQQYQQPPQQQYQQPPQQQQQYVQTNQIPVQQQYQGQVPQQQNQQYVQQNVQPNVNQQQNIQPNVNQQQQQPNVQLNQNQQNNLNQPQQNAIPQTNNV
ncbi:nucleobindin-2 isoform X2 [Microplitis demolitor]|uniref:nucleobindin-2 isoform X2 n=1 Tax=Microplitis demolitor TaxID=69319 RepID=UPI0006D4FC76|nr:nucleobindin-2 isoform X2 [Microplitis demolitor]